MSELAAIKALSRETKALILVSEFEARRMPVFQLREVLELLVDDPQEQKVIADMVENDLRATGYSAEQVSAFLTDLLSAAPSRSLTPEAEAVLSTRKLKLPFAMGFEGEAPAADAAVAPAAPPPVGTRARASKILPSVAQPTLADAAVAPAAPPAVGPRARASKILPSVAQPVPGDAAPAPPAPAGIPFLGKGKTMVMGPPQEVPPAGAPPTPSAPQVGPKARGSGTVPAVLRQTPSAGVPPTAPEALPFFGKGKTISLGPPPDVPPSAGAKPAPPSPGEQPFFGKGRTIMMGPRPDAPAPPLAPSPPPGAGAQRRSTFVFTAPPAPAGASAAPPTPASPDVRMPVGQKSLPRHDIVFGGKGSASAPPMGSKQLVLIADDDRRARMVFRIRIEEAGYETVECATGDEAWARIQQGGVALAVLDMKMPGMHGLEIISNIAEKRPGLPVVVCTAYDQLQEEFAVKTYPKLKYLVKPVAPDALVQAVNELLAAKSTA